MTGDKVTAHLDRIAQMLESGGYAIDVNYASATITVWIEEWPISVEIKSEKERDESGEAGKADEPDKNWRT